jgi:hypothetical protein
MWKSCSLPGQNANIENVGLKGGNNWLIRHFAELDELLRSV